MAYYQGKRKQKKMSKVDALLRHARSRSTRTGSFLSFYDIRQIQERTSRNESVFLISVSNNKKLHAILYEGRIRIFLYDKQRKSVITFLSENMLEVYEDINMDEVFGKLEKMKCQL